jgi:molybdopterin molybdotransferase
MGDPANALLPLDDALALLLQQASPRGSETRALEDAAGRVLANPVRARRDRPAQAVSAMDGYAISTAQAPAVGTAFEVLGASYPGAPWTGPLEDGEAIRVTTGAHLPPTASRILIDERVDVGPDGVRVVSAVESKTHIRLPGSDFREGEILLSAGSTLTTTGLMIAAAGEAETVEVLRRPTLALLTIGDEFAPALDPALRTPESLSLPLSRLASLWGGHVVRRAWFGDDPEWLAVGLTEALREADLVVTIGGASGSERDGARGAAKAIGAEMLFQGVAIRPGKPAWAARRDGRLIVGLPGNPIAALVAARLLLIPAAMMASGSATEASAWRKAPALDALPAEGPRDRILLATRGAEGVAVIPTQDTASHARLDEVTALARRPAGSPAAAPGDPLAYLALEPPTRLA